MLFLKQRKGLLPMASNSKFAILLLGGCSEKYSL